MVSNGCSTPINLVSQPFRPEEEVLSAAVSILAWPVRVKGRRPGKMLRAIQERRYR